jgi:hypothetical protein
MASSWHNIQNGSTLNSIISGSLHVKCKHHYLASRELGVLFRMPFELQLIVGISVVVQDFLKKDLNICFFKKN